MKRLLSIACLLPLLAVSLAALAGFDTDRITATQPPVSGGGGVLVVTDSFNRANSGTLGSAWTVNYNGGLQIVSTNAIGSAGSWNGNYWSSNSFSANQYARVTIHVFPTGGNACVSVRNNVGGLTGTVTGYWLSVDGTNVKIVRLDAGLTSNTTLVSVGGTGLGAGTTIELDIVGSTLNAYTNGVIACSATDATYSSGEPGISCYDQVNFSPFVAGNL